jgi:hypothetical protein
MTQADAAAPPQALRAALLATGLLPATVQTLGQDLGWLADVAAQNKPFATAVHCLCTAP